MVVLLVVSQLVLHNPGGRDEAEAADGHQSRGEEHPEATHTAEHGGSSGQQARKDTQMEPEPDFFFLLLAQERMHLELTPSRAGRQLGQVRQGCAVCVSRASGNSARNRPKHISKVSVNSSHTPFSFLTADRQTPGSLGKLGLRSPAREGPEQVGQVKKNESCGHQHVPEPPACSSLSCCHRLSLCQRRVCTSSRSP